MHSYPLRSKRHLLGALALAGAAFGLLMLQQPARAQTEAWPGKPIRVIVNFPAGGAADQIARAVTVPLQAALVLIALATLLTILGGLIPAKSASKCDPVKALRSE